MGKAERVAMHPSPAADASHVRVAENICEEGRSRVRRAGQGDCRRCGELG